MAEIYIICSDDPLLKKDREDEIVQQAKQKYPEAVYILLTNSDFGTSSTSPNLTILENELMDPGLFGGDRIIKIYLKDLDKTTVEVLNLIVKRYREGVVIIIDLPRIIASYTKLQGKPYEEKKGKKSLETQKKDAISYVKGIGGTIEVLYPPEGDNLIRFIANRANNKNLVFNNEAIRYLCDSADGNLVAIDQLLNQIALSDFAKQQITTEILAKIFTQDSRYFAYDYIDALISGQGIKALNILNSVCSEQGQSKMQVLPMILNRLNTVIESIYKGQELNLSRLDYAKKQEFYNKYGYRLPKSQNIIMMAINNMPEVLLNYLTKSIAKASIDLKHFDTNNCFLKLQNMAIAVNNFAVMQLEEIE